ncbi:uncharacterized protein [Nicotiana tomentosiformis]|uniref:uncharacterized protein n=1 Tax=Nicotiana tomentosiformis TaxID=4098 RepID=UPI00388C5C33
MYVKSCPYSIARKRFNQYLKDAQSHEDDSDYDNNADKSGDDTPFPYEGNDDENENEQPDLSREHDATNEYKIKEYITFVHQVYGCTITKRKAFLGRKRAFEIAYGNWDKSVAALPRYMVVLQHFNLGTVVEWKLEQSRGMQEFIFRYVFCVFKPAIDGFVHCRPVISIYDTHVYGKYDIKLVIVVVVDANGSIFPLTFAICANEIQETWILFLNHLKEHVVKQRSESFNGLFKSSRELPIIAMVRMSFKQMVERFVERSISASSLMERGVEFMPKSMKRFKKYRKRAQCHIILQYCNERNIFEVRTGLHQNRDKNTHTINESRRLCLCGKWSIYHLPCSHDMEFFQHTGFAATRYVDKEYSVAAYVNTYSGHLQSVGAEHYWPPEPFKMVCNKDYMCQRQVQKRTRIHNQMDVGYTIYARKRGICSQIGHDRRKCPSVGLGSGGNLAPSGSSSNVPNYQG